MKGLDQQIRKYYLSKAIREETLQDLLTGADPRRSRRGSWAVSIGLVALLLLAVLWLRGGQDLTDRVAAEIAVNHIRNVPMDVESSHYEVVQAELSRLGFPVLPTRRDVLDSHDLVGGRYCSLDGAEAAQLRLRERSSGEPCTLYVSRLHGKAHGIRTGVVTRHGVCVDLWTANGLVYGLARYDRGATE